MNATKLRRLLIKTWSKETSSEPEKWTKRNPAWGQCAVTALIVQDFFGGWLLEATITINGEKILHHWNRLHDGKELDLTRGQFLDKIAVPPGELRTREYLLSYRDTQKRYYLLKSEVANKITASNNDRG